MWWYLSRSTSDVPMPTIWGRQGGQKWRGRSRRPAAPQRRAATHHVCAVDGRGHLDLPEVLALPQLLGAPDGRSAAAVLRVEVHLTVVTAQQGGRGLTQVIPDPVEICKSERLGRAASGAPPGGHQPSPGARCSRSSSSPQWQSLPRRTACRPPQKGASLWLSQSQKDSPVTGTALGTGGGAVASGSESESLCWEERAGCAHPPSPPPALCPPVAHTVSMP